MIHKIKIMWDSGKGSLSQTIIEYRTHEPADDGEMVDTLFRISDAGRLVAVDSNGEVTDIIDVNGASTVTVNQNRLL